MSKRVWIRFACLFVGCAGAPLTGCGDDAGPPACDDDTHLECTCPDSGAMGLVACEGGVLGACVCEVPDGGAACSADIQCDDGAFCNGIERCLPDAEDANERGCVVGMLKPYCEDEIACTVDRCSDQLNRCVHEAPDADGDGYGDAACEGAEGVALGDDCDDDDPLRYPGAFEVCDPDNRDEDCDPETFGDKDSDGDGAVDIACCNGDNCGDDCDDSLLSRRPLQVEFCDEVDNDCDGTVDEETAEVPWFVDGDGDGFGGDGDPLMSCVPIPGRSLVATDCADGNAARHPGQLELCDFVDNNCDGAADEGQQCGMPTGFPVGEDGGAVGGGGGAVGGGGTGGMTGSGGMMGTGGEVGPAPVELMECPTDRGLAGATEVSGSIRDGEAVWSGVVHMTGEVRVYGTGRLTIMPGTTVLAGSGARLNVGYSGAGARLNAVGTEQAPIRFCGSTDLAGYWQGLRVAANVDLASSMAWVLIADGGSAGPALELDGAVPMTDVHVRNASQMGIEASTFGLGSARVYSSGNELPLVILDDQAMTRLPPESHWAGNARDVIEIRDASWASALTVHDAGVPYLLKNDLDLRGDVPHVFEAGSHFIIEPDVQIELGWSSNTPTISMDGTQEAPVVFEGRIAESGSWGGVLVGPGVRSASYLRHVRIRHAGNAGVGIPALRVRAQIELLNVHLEDNSGIGLWVDAVGLDADSGNNRVHRTTGQAVRIHADAITKLGSAMDIANNSDDRIQIEQSTNISSSGTIRDFGVPYYLPFGVTTRTPSAITIEAGAEFEMGNDSLFLIGWSSHNVSVSAVGSAGNPIVFRHEGGGDGLWQGVQLGPNVSTTSELKYVRFEDGGSAAQGSLHIRMSNPLPVANLANCSFDDSAAYGLYLNSDYGVDYTGNGNSFSNNGLGDVYVP